MIFHIESLIVLCYGNENGKWEIIENSDNKIRLCKDTHEFTIKIIKRLREERITIIDERNKSVITPISSNEEFWKGEYKRETGVAIAIMLLMRYCVKCNY